MKNRQSIIRLLCCAIIIAICATVLVCCTTQENLNMQTTETVSEFGTLLTPPSNETEFVYGEIVYILRNEKGLRVQERGLNSRWIYEYNEKGYISKILHVTDTAGTFTWVSEFDADGRATKAPLVTEFPNVQKPYGSTFYFVYDQDGKMVENRLVNNVTNQMISSRHYNAEDKLILYGVSNGGMWRFDYEQGYVMTGSFYDQDKEINRIVVGYTQEGMLNFVNSFSIESNWQLFECVLHMFDKQGGCVLKKYQYDKSGNVQAYTEEIYNHDWKIISHTLSENNIVTFKQTYDYLENGNVLVNEFLQNELGELALCETYTLDKNGNRIED